MESEESVKKSKKQAKKKSPAKKEASSSSDESMKSAEEESESKPKRRGRKKKAESSHESSEEKPEPKRKSKKPPKEEKKMDKKKAARTLNPKPHLRVLEENPILSRKKAKNDDFPDKDVSVFANNREPIYRVCKGDLAGLKKLLKRTETVSTLFQAYSSDIEKNALHFALERKDFVAAKLLIAELQKEINRTPKLIRAKLPQVNLSVAVPRRANRYQFGFATRAVGASRGGKEGNMAFSSDLQLSHVSFLVGYISAE